MTPERHQQIKRLFLAAVELAPEQAQQFLDHACGEDQGLRLEVQTLLDHHRPETLLEYTSATETAVTSQASAASMIESALAATAEELPAALPAGTMIAGRYRIAALLGRGGMGVVYRAEDTELQQSVALKFLNPNIKDLPDAIEFLRREVRLARPIAHPNVVQVFDIRIADREVFIVMEYVAGEDLASLVKRVGPLPPTKVLQIARQLAAGIAAAHGAGVLHRDLKPGNVMIDGAGNVRILDFGVAATLEDKSSLFAVAGTPGFVAPEVLAGQSPSPQSDLYAWGLVIYFAATGKLPTVENTSNRESAANVLASAGLSSELTECVGSCLQCKPKLRPRSALDLIAGLARGDPLGAILQAGQMPRPEQVTAAPSWQPPAWLVDGLLAGGLALLIAILVLADRTLFLSRCGLVKSPAALREAAERTLLAMGREAPAGPVLTGVTLDANCLHFVRAHPQIPAAWSKLSAGEIPAVFFWYRQGDPRLPRPAPLGESVGERLAQPTPGTATIRLDGRGKLLSLQIADVVADEKAFGGVIDWAKLFKAAGLPWPEFQETEVARCPPLFAEEVHAWEGPFGADPSMRVRVTAAARQGRVVFFDVDQPWEHSQSVDAVGGFSNQATLFVTLRAALWLIAIAIAAVLAWHHARRGHADWQGAWRVTAVVLVLASCAWLLGSQHSLVLTEELTAGFLWLNVIVFCGASAGVAYLAVEPLARRWWPWSIITTRRLLGGRRTDCGIWADALLGLVVGLAAVLARQVGTLVNQLSGVPVSGLNDFDLGQNLLDHFALQYKAVIIVTALQWAVVEALLVLTLIVALRRLLKSTLAAALLVVLLLASLAIVGRGIVAPVDWLTRTLLCSIATWLLLRHGLLTTTAALATFYLVNNSPVTLKWSAWYAPTGNFVVVMLAIALVACWRLSRPTTAQPTATALPT